MERVGGRQTKMEGHCSTSQSPQWAVVLMEVVVVVVEKEEEEDLINDTIFEGKLLNIKCVC